LWKKRNRNEGGKGKKVKWIVKKRPLARVKLKKKGALSVEGGEKRGRQEMGDLDVGPNVAIGLGSNMVGRNIYISLAIQAYVKRKTVVGRQ